MQNVSAWFKEYASLPEREIQLKVVIGSKVYDTDSVISFEISNALISGDEFTLGSVISSTLSLSLRTNDTIDIDKVIAPYVRLGGAHGYTDWYCQGLFFVDSKKKQNGVWKISGFDRLIYARKQYIPTVTFPAILPVVLYDVCNQIGTNIHEDTLPILDSTYVFDKDPSCSLRDMVSGMAGLHGSSVSLSKEGKLKFIDFLDSSAPVIVTPADYVKAEITESLKSYTKIVCYLNSNQDTLEAGNLSASIENTLNFSCAFMNTAMMSKVLTRIGGFTYMPFDMDWRGFPYIETGDKVSVTLRDGTEFVSTILLNKVSFKGGLKSTINAPGAAVSEDYQYMSTVKSQIDSATKRLNDNVLLNTGFERYIYGTRQPIYWSGGTVVTEKRFRGAHSLKLASYQMLENLLAYRPLPTTWDEGRCKFLFKKLGGACQMQIFDSNTWAPIMLTLPDNSESTVYNIPFNKDWGTSFFNVTFDSTGKGKIWIRFTNVDAIASYIDCVQLCPWDGKSEIEYVDGLQSSPFSDSYSSIWVEYISVAFSSSLTIVFDNIYSTMPNISINTDTGISPTIVYSTDGSGNYIGCTITFTSGTASHVSISVIGKV